MLKFWNGDLFGMVNLYFVNILGHRHISERDLNLTFFPCPFLHLHLKRKWEIDEDFVLQWNQGLENDITLGNLYVRLVLIINCLIWSSFGIIYEVIKYFPEKDSRKWKIHLRIYKAEQDLPTCSMRTVSSKRSIPLR